MPPKNPVRSQYAPFSDCPAVLKEYLDYLLTIRGRSPRTVDGYYIEIRSFLRYLKLSRSGLLEPSLEERTPSELFGRTEISDVTLEMIASVSLSDVYAYLNFMNTEFLNSASARARKVSALNGFYKYLSTRTSYLSDNPIQNLDLPSKRKTLPKYLSLEESIRLLECADSPDKTRDFCILTLFLNCGMRLSELVFLNIEDYTDGQLRLLGKGNKERLVYLNEPCRDALDAYIKESAPIRRKDRAIFVSKQGQRLTPRRIEQIVADRLRDAGLSDKGYTPHKLRHTAATLMYQYGSVDVRILKEILGHANLATTEIYTHVSDKQMKNAAESSPLAHRNHGRRSDGENM